MTAMPWFVYRLTHSAMLLGLVAFLSQIFLLIISPFAGTFADQYDKKKILTVTQSLAMVQALILAALTLTGTIHIWHIIVLAVFGGIINAFDMPTRQSFLVEMIEKKDLMNAIGLNSLVFNGARLVGPAIAGLLIASVGEGYCFLINGLSFIAIIIALNYIVPIRNVETGKKSVPLSEKFGAGLAYIRKSKKVAWILVLLSVTGLTGMFPMVLMPVFVKDIFKLGASGLGMFMSAMGVGALFGTYTIASKQSSQGLDKIIFNSALCFGVIIVMFSFVRNIPVTLVLIALAGYFLVLQMGLTNTFIQLSVPDELRGRVMGFFTTAFMGFGPIGSLIAGFIAHKISAPVSVAVGGVITLVSAVILRRKVLSNE